eukprot:gene2429-4719_t
MENNLPDHQMPVFERVRKRFFKRVGESIPMLELGSSTGGMSRLDRRYLTNQRHPDSQAMTRFGFTISQIETILRLMSCDNIDESSLLKFDGAVQTLQFMTVLFNSLSWGGGGGGGGGSRSHNTDSPESVRERERGGVRRGDCEGEDEGGRRFKWPLVEMAEFEFTGRGVTLDMW